MTSLLMSLMLAASSVQPSALEKIVVSAAENAANASAAYDGTETLQVEILIVGVTEYEPDDGQLSPMPASVSAFGPQ